MIGKIIRKIDIFSGRRIEFTLEDDNGYKEIVSMESFVDKDLEMVNCEQLIDSRERSAEKASFSKKILFL